MKTALYVVALLVIGAACYFSLEQTRKFEELQGTRLQTIKDNTRFAAQADQKEKELKDERGVLEEVQNQKAFLTQSISALKSTGQALQRDVAQLDVTLDIQKAEFEELDKALAEVEKILKGLEDLGVSDINYDNLPQKIEEIEDDKKQKIAKVEELETLIEAADKLLTKNKDELGRLVQRKVTRDANIGRNSMEAVINTVNQAWGFVVIGAGSNQGFTPQTSLIVQRNGRLVGRVRPSSIEPTQTIAEIDYASLAPGVRILPGDRAILKNPNTN